MSRVEKSRPLLAGRAGVYRERSATGRLAQSFQCVWSHRVADDFSGRIAIVPDGCSDLIWNGEQLVVVGPDRVAAFPELGAGSHMLGLRFRPGAALTWLDIPLCELVGQTVPLSQLWGGRAEAIEARLLEAAPGQRFALLLSLLEACDFGEPAADMQALFRRLSGARRATGLSGLAGDIALGERTLRRRSQQHFGYGPKTLERILRFQSFLRGARQQHEDLAGLALNAGYADQAHMSREVKALTTLTPQDIRSQVSA